MFLIPTLNDILKLDVLPENIRCYEDRCPAGLDPASLPQKELLEKDTGSLPGVTVRFVMLISFIKTISFRSHM